MSARTNSIKFTMGSPRYYLIFGTEADVDIRLEGVMPFIVSTDAKKTDPAMRKLIRTHVMIGKNRGRTLPSRTRKPTQLWAKVNRTSTEGSDESADSFTTKSSLVVPSRVGTDVSFIQFADTVEPSSIAVIFHFTHIAKKALFPLEACIHFDRDGTWVLPLTIDAAYLHSMILMTGYIDSLIRGQSGTSNQETPSSLIKTLQLLRKRLLLEDEEAMSSYTTISVVLSLAVYSYLKSEYETARHHMEGLRKIVDLRGGLANFKNNVKLLIEMLRWDIGMTLRSGVKPLFFSDASWEPPIPYPSRALSSELEFFNTRGSICIPEERFQGVDNDLVKAWENTFRFSLLVNLAFETAHKIPKEILLDTMASVMYRLLQMSFETGSVDEAMRLGLLAFSSSIFLQWQGVKLSYEHLPVTYRACLVNLKLSDGSPPLLLWLLVIGSIAIFGEPDSVWLKPWLRVNINLCGVTSWGEMQEILQSFLWIGLVHDKPGKALFDSTLSLGHTVNVR
ncbi:hypothetical protein F5B20DRAFT_540274 [Whalleya microplaca]|nr:hypothetical protein F5B20DRAFT_540274 [Whalleya microplaca]